MPSGLPAPPGPRTTPWSVQVRRSRELARPIAVGLLPGPVEDVRKRQGELRGALASHDLYFYDATTHPLGRV